MFQLSDLENNTEIRLKIFCLIKNTGKTGISFKTPTETNKTLKKKEKKRVGKLQT